MAMRSRKSRSSTDAIDQLAVQQLRIQVRDDAARANGLAAFGDHADGAALLDQHFAHRARHADVDAALGGGLGHGLRNRAHAADGMAPGALLAVHLAEHMVQQNVGGAGGVRARVVADDAVEAVGRLDGGALEPGVQIVAGRFDEQIQELAAHGHVEFGDALAQLRAAQQFGHRLEPTTGRDVGRSFQHEIAQHVRDDVEPLRVLGKRPASRAENLATSCSVLPAPIFRYSAVVQRQEIR